jgi:divalent metal cation (Fe/Co/Zn/Cd) transporter
VAQAAQISHAIARIRRLQTFTIAWMVVEAAISLWAAWRAQSPALVAFGGDSAIELLSASVVLWRFRDSNASEATEVRAAKIAGVLLILLAVFVLTISCAALLGYAEAAPSYSGIGLLIAATFVMPWLAWQKRRLSDVTGSVALRADAAESMLCAYLSLIALLGLLARTLLHVSRADPIAALVAIPLIVWEGRRALRGEACGCVVREKM